MQTPTSPFKKVDQSPKATFDLLVFNGQTCKLPFRPSRRPSTANYALQDVDDSMIHVLSQESFDVSGRGAKALLKSPKEKQREKDDRVARTSIAKDPAPATPRTGRVRASPGGPTTILLG